MSLILMMHMVLANNNIGPIEKIVDMQAMDGKIFSMHWLEDHHLILCGHFGSLSLWRLDYHNGKSKPTVVYLQQNRFIK